MGAVDYLRCLARHLARRAGLGDRGASTVEYALVIALIVLVCFAALEFFGAENDKSLDNSSSNISQAG